MQGEQLTALLAMTRRQQNPVDSPKNRSPGVKTNGEWNTLQAITRRLFCTPLFLFTFVNGRTEIIYYTEMNNALSVQYFFFMNLMVHVIIIINAQLTPLCILGLCLREPIQNCCDPVDK